jgi:hypothetical protein
MWKYRRTDVRNAEPDTGKWSYTGRLLTSGRGIGVSATILKRLHSILCIVGWNHTRYRSVFLLAE